MALHITGQTTKEQAIIALSDGNPSAMMICNALIGVAPQIDLATNPNLYLIQLDELGMYGDRLIELFRVVCRGNIANLVILLKGLQQGLFDGPTNQFLQRAIEQRDLQIDFLDISQVLHQRMYLFRAFY